MIILKNTLGLLCKLFLSILVTLFSVPSAAAPQTKSQHGRAISTLKPLGFKDWKAQKIFTSSEKIKFLKSKIQKISQESGQGLVNNPQAAQIENDLNQELWNLDAAQELTFPQYVALYVKDLEGTQKYSELAALLTKEEVAQLLELVAKPAGSKASQKP